MLLYFHIFSFSQGIQPQGLYNSRLCNINSIRTEIAIYQIMQHGFIILNAVATNIIASDRKFKRMGCVDDPVGNPTKIGTP